MNPIERNTHHAAGMCRIQGLGACQREERTITFLFDPSRRERISTCLRCDKSGFIPLGPQPAIDFLNHRQGRN